MPTLALAFDPDPALIRSGVIYMVGLILSITVHEFGHAFVADRLGDRLPRAQKRVTLNPIAHIDPLGTIAFPLIAFVLAASGSALGGRILGWGKPVQIALDPRLLRRGWTVRGAHMLIALAGPLMNVLLALVLSLTYIGLRRAHLTTAAEIVASGVGLNIGLAFFNLFPCPPLDGGTIALLLLPRNHPVATFLKKWGAALFFALLMTGFLVYVMWPAQALGGLWMRQINLWGG